MRNTEQKIQKCRGSRDTSQPSRQVGYFRVYKGLQLHAPYCCAAVDDALRLTTACVYVHVRIVGVRTT